MKLPDLPDTAKGAVVVALTKAGDAMVMNLGLTSMECLGALVFAAGQMVQKDDRFSIRPPTNFSNE